MADSVVILPTDVKGVDPNICGLLPPDPVVSVYSLPITQLRALDIIRQNISALLVARRESQSGLAAWLRKDKSWINKFLNGHREIQLKDLDRIADYFGLATYQLFQPGISPLTERRSASDRRSGRDRRIGHQQREASALAAIVAATHPRMKKRADTIKQLGHNSDLPDSGEGVAGDGARVTASPTLEARVIEAVALLVQLTESLGLNPERPRQQTPAPRKRATGRAAGAGNAGG